MKKELNNLMWDCKTSSAQGYSQREPEMVDSFRGNFFLYFHICQEEVRGVVEEEIRKRKEKRKGKREKILENLPPLCLEISFFV